MKIQFFLSLEKKEIIVIFILALSGNVFSQLQYVAHRGASFFAPENTLAAVNLAWILNCDAVECDVRLTRDNKIVLFHDKDTKRLTEENYLISETNYSKLNNLTIKLVKTNSSCFEGEKIPLLKDALKTIPDGRTLVIEIKCGVEIFPKLKKVISKHWKSGNITFIAFNFETICKAKELFPNVPCYYLSSSWDNVQKHFDEIVEYKLDGVDMYHKSINKDVMEQLKEMEKDVWAWTINSPEVVLRMKELGVHFITTDRPYWLKETIQ